MSRPHISQFFKVFQVKLCCFLIFDLIYVFTYLSDLFALTGSI